jgi:hypothetical protein
MHSLLFLLTYQGSRHATEDDVSLVGNETGVMGGSGIEVELK